MVQEVGVLGYSSLGLGYCSGVLGYSSLGYWGRGRDYCVMDTPDDVGRGERGRPIFKKVGPYLTPLFEGGKGGDY